MNEKKFEILIETGRLAGRRYAVGASGARLGRSSSNDIVVPDEELSRNHCLFELADGGKIRVIDLASANGTFVNGTQVGGEPVVLEVGDEILFGTTSARVVYEGESAPPRDVPSAEEFDLGLGSAPSGGTDASAAAKGPAAPARRRSPLAAVLWVAAGVLLLLAVWLLFLDAPQIGIGTAPTDSGVQAIEEGPEKIVEMSYEKVSADSEGIFRYQMDLSPDGTLKVSVDDVPKSDRHIVKSAQLGDAARARIQEIFSDPAFRALDRDYAGPTEEPPRLESCQVTVVFSRRVKIVRVANTPEPDAFRQMRERLEAFSKNELGIWAIQYSTDKLVELAEASAHTAEEKWNDREVEYGNLHASIAAWREAMFYLETVNPKPPAFETYRASREKAEKELEKRFAEQRFRADRAINLADWKTAAVELKVLCALVPDRADERYREAAAKLVDVEKRQKKGGTK